jgi:hypothetical protein
VAENEQKRCNGKETALGEVAYKEATDAVKALFGTGRKRASLDYESAVKELADRGDKSAKDARAAVESLLKAAAAVPAGNYTFPDRPATPSKPAGFA